MSFGFLHCAHPENIHTPPTEGSGIHFLEGGGFCKTQKFKEMCKALLKFPEGWDGGGGVLEKKTFRGGGGDIFWNYRVHHPFPEVMSFKV